MKQVFFTLVGVRFSVSIKNFGQYKNFISEKFVKKKRTLRKIYLFCPFIEVLCLPSAFVLFLATLHLQQTLFCLHTSTFPSVRF